ncbi:MAG TPA: glycoside hydrolase family 3 C-terminal domain-containing protein [Lachnospiraceae bacterium]|nr:glycoside hydrolase family 3 C-terminal domain-containing protein [Lachnospiraceae bacterium]
MTTKKMKPIIYTGTTTQDITEREVRNRALTREAAAEGMVLLKNQDVLPIASGKKIALFGAGARHTVKGGTGSGDVNERHSVSIEEGLRNAGYEIVTQSWLDDYDNSYMQSRLDWKKELERIGEEKNIGIGGAYFSSPAYKAPAGRLITQADIESASTDTAIYVISRVAGEGADRLYTKGDYLLTDEEKENIKIVAKAFRKTLLVINAGGVVDLSILDEADIPALMFISQPGMEGGNAFCDIISGKVTPSGKLTSTWARNYEDYPNAKTFSHMNGNIIEEYYEEGIFVGYRYFDSFQVQPRYAFGDGLSYTQFLVKTEQVTVANQAVEVTVSVENTGNQYAGKEIVQVYASCPQGRLVKEYQRLVAFGKTGSLNPGEKETLVLRFGLWQLESYDTGKASYIMEKGDYQVRVGQSSTQTQVAAVIELQEDVVTEKLTNVCPLHNSLKEIKPEKPYPNETYDGVPRITLKSTDIRKNAITYGRKQEIPEDIRNLVERMSEKELATLACGAQGGNSTSIIGAAGFTVPGAAGETTGILRENYNIPAIVLADGPAGIRLADRYQVNEKDGSIYQTDFFSTVEKGFLQQHEWHEEAKDYYQYCTAIPVGTLLAQTFDEELLKRVGAMIAEEMDEFRVTLWLAPGLNIHRNPLCGRNFEYYSEDPFVSGIIAAAITLGVQTVGGVGTTIKHFACNNQEDNRRGSDSIVSERALREIYLKGFEIAVKTSQPMSIMTSYNKINGVHAANNYDLCTKVAREEWGFEGVIMTDWTTTNNGGGSSAAKCMSAGNDLVMPGNSNDIKEILEALDGSNGQNLSIEDLRNCAARTIRIIQLSNQYEDADSYLNHVKLV